MRVLIINNLIAGLGDGTIYDFIRAFSEDGDEIIIRNTNGTTRIETLLFDAESFACVVVAGGDGSVVSACYALRNTGTPILPFPSGTANLLATNLNLPETAPALAAIVRELRTLDFDLAEMEVTDEDGVAQTHGFGIIAGAGFDAAIMHDAVPMKQSFGPMAYFLAALGNASPTVSHFSLDLDDEHIEVDGIAVLAINFAKILPDISVSHGNDARDGLFEVGILTSQNAFGLFPGLIAAVLDREGGFPARSDAIDFHSAARIRVEADPPLHIQFDGDTIEAMTPFSARTLPRATRLIVSEQEYVRITGETPKAGA